MNVMLESPPPAAPVRRAGVLLVDDHPLVRQGLAMVINAEPDLVVCAEAGGTAEALKALAEPGNVAVAVVDLSLPEGDGAVLIRQMLARRPNLAVLVLSMHSEGLHAERVLRAGARGYVMKHEATDSVLTAIRTVLRGGVWVSEKIRSRMIGLALDPEAGADADLRQMTDREVEVFALLGRGLAPAEIGRRLGVSVKTVDTHRERIKTKLGLRSGGELLRRAIGHAMGEDLRPDRDATRHRGA